MITSARRRGGEERRGEVCIPPTLTPPPKLNYSSFKA